MPEQVFSFFKHIRKEIRGAFLDTYDSDIEQKMETRIVYLVS